MNEPSMYPTPPVPTEYPVELVTTPKMRDEMIRRGWIPPERVTALLAWLARNETLSAGVQRILNGTVS